MIFFGAALLQAAFAATLPWAVVGDQLVVTEVRADLSVPILDWAEAYYLSPAQSRELEAVLEETLSRSLGAVEEIQDRAIAKFRITARSEQITKRASQTAALEPVRLAVPAELRIYFHPSTIASPPIPLAFYVRGSFGKLEGELKEIKGQPVVDGGKQLLDALTTGGCGPLLTPRKV